MAADEPVVDLFGVLCNTDTVDADGIEWTVDLEGWDSPDQRSPVGDPAGRHGGVPMGDLWGVRTLVAVGEAVAPTQALAWDAYYRLTGSMPGLGKEGTVVVHEPTPKQLTVRQSGPPRVSSPVRGLVSFRLTLGAMDPLKQGTTLKSVTIGPGSSVAVTNAGNESAEPVLTTGGAGLVNVSSDHGGTISTDTSVPSGTVFDVLHRDVSSPTGDDLFTATSPGMLWFSLPPGDTNVHNSGTQPVTLTFRDAYA
jgi:hypothetical protein